MKVKVPLFGVGAMRAVQIERDATVGGTIGVNILNADGTIYDPTQAITDIVDAATAPQGGDGIALEDVRIVGPESVAVAGALWNGQVTLRLVGDVVTPGETYFYGTAPDGTKGWVALSSTLVGSAEIALTVNGDGTVTFDLAPLADDGTGLLVGITRDAYGRIQGTRAVTTDDLPQGSVNLYYTGGGGGGGGGGEILIMDGSSAPPIMLTNEAETDFLYSDGGDGGGGGGGGETTFIFIQASASATWNIAHGLGGYPSVTVVDSGGTVVVGDVSYVDGNNVTLTFGAAFAGKAYLNI